MGDTATLPNPGSKTDKPVCSQCGSELPKATGWCPKCGYYAQFGIFVDSSEDTLKPAAGGSRHVPKWAIVLGLTVFGTFALSIAGRMMTPADSTPRLLWALGQLFGGLIAFFGAHTVNYMCAIMEAAEFTLLDYVLKPAALWKIAIAQLPESLPRLAFGLGGILSAFFALVIVDGIPWSSLFADKAPPPHPTINLAQAIVDHAKTGPADDNIEDAVKNFAKGKKDEEKKKEIRNETLDCVVLGYEPNGRDRIASMYLASVVDGKLRYVGQVSEGIPLDRQELLRARFKDCEVRQPFVPAVDDAGVKWLKPIFTCRVKFQRWSSEKRLVDAAFEKSLADIDLR